MTIIIKTSEAPGKAVRLRDGTEVRIGPIGRDAAGMLTACFDGLSATSRRQRFFGAKQALTEADLAYLTSADGRDHLAFVATAPEVLGRAPEVLGAARCVRSGPGSETAELALAVVDRAQGRGVASALLDHLIDAARAQGIRRLRCEVLADNEAMRRLAKRLGGEVRWLDDGAVEYRCALPETAPSAAVGRPPLETPVTATGPQLAACAPPEVWTGSLKWVLAASVAWFETAALAWYHAWSPWSVEP